MASAVLPNLKHQQKIKNTQDHMIGDAGITARNMDNMGRLRHFVYSEDTHFILEVQQEYL